MENYKYQLDITDRFIDLLYPDNKHYQESCRGLVSAHGDKSTQYKEEWEAKGLDFNRASVIYLLTYTNQMSLPKHKSKEWVIEFYDRYSPLLEMIEAEVSGGWPISPAVYTTTLFPHLLREVGFSDQKIKHYKSLTHSTIKPIEYTDWNRIYPGMNSNHGRILYLLSYTDLRQPDVNRYIWIQTMAPTYLPKLRQLEKDIPMPT